MKSVMEIPAAPHYPESTKVGICKRLYTKQAKEKAEHIKMKQSEIFYTKPREE